MRKILIVILLFPLLALAQTKKPTPSNIKADLKKIEKTLDSLKKKEDTKIIPPSLQNGHNIQISLKPYPKDTKIYIGTNYGNSKVLADSCVLNEKSEGVFSGKEKLTPGIYFVVSPQKSILFDFLVDDLQHFKISADTNDLRNVVITGSKENDMFKSYSQEINNLFVELNQIEQKFKAAKTEKDSSAFKSAYLAKDKEIKQKRRAFIQSNPGSMMSFLLNTMEVPEAPSIPIVNGKADSIYPYRYVKDHYWDNVVFNDNRLLRTPFFENKLDDYFKNFVSREPDSIISEVQYMLSVAKTGKEIYPFLLFKFTNKYISPEFMGQDKVFVHIYQNFFAKGDTILLNEASKKSLKERAYSLMANQLGLPAPILVLNDANEKRFSLYNTKAAYTFVAFWDPTCSHCKIEIPKLDSMYKANWISKDVKVIAVNINNKEKAAWKTFINEHQLTQWINAYQTDEDFNKEVAEGRPTTIRQLYDVFKTPTFYLLDKDKKIVAKNLSIEQFNDFILSTQKK